MPIASLCCKGESLEHGEKYLGQNGGERQQRATREQESVSEASVSFCLELRPSHSPAVWVSVLLRFTKPGKFSSSSFSLCSSLFTESILPLHSASSFICWDTENRPLSQNSHVLTRARASGEHIFVVPQKGQWLYLLRATLLKKKRSGSKPYVLNMWRLHVYRKRCLEDILCICGFAWEALQISFKFMNQDRLGLKTQNPQLASQYIIFGKSLPLS